MNEFEAIEHGLNKLHEKLSGEIKEHAARQDEKINAALTELGQKSSGYLPGHFGTKSGDDLGAQVVAQFNENRSIFEKSKMVRLEIKAAGDAITTSSGRTIASGGVGAPIGGRTIGLQNAIPARRLPATSAVEYSRFTGIQGGASVQAGEGASKSAIRPDHSLITQSALTVAGYANVSRQALNDSAELRQAINVTLMRSIASALDDALYDGNITPAWAGFSTLATAFSTSSYPALVDSISAAASTMQTDGFNPDVVAMHPTDWLKIITATGTASDHYMASYLGEVEMVLRGLRVVLSPSMSAGTAMVLDSQHSELLVVDDFSIEIGYTSDQFVKNVCTVLGELRVIPVFRTVGSALLVN